MTLKRIVLPLHVMDIGQIVGEIGERFNQRVQAISKGFSLIPSTIDEVRKNCNTNYNDYPGVIDELVKKCWRDARGDFEPRIPDFEVKVKHYTSDGLNNPQTTFIVDIYNKTLLEKIIYGSTHLDEDVSEFYISPGFYRYNNNGVHFKRSSDRKDYIDTEIIFRDEYQPFLINAIDDYNKKLKGQRANGFADFMGQVNWNN